MYKFFIYFSIAYLMAQKKYNIQFYKILPLLRIGLVGILFPNYKSMLFAFMQTLNEQSGIDYNNGMWTELSCFKRGKLK